MIKLIKGNKLEIMIRGYPVGFQIMKHVFTDNLVFFLSAKNDMGKPEREK